MMYPSLNNIHSKPPQDLYHTPSSSSFQIPSPIYLPIEDEAVFCEFFQQRQFFSNDQNYNTLDPEMPNNVNTAMVECSNKNGKVATKDGDDQQFDFLTHVTPDTDNPRKIPSIRDRQSKINTALGPRDRRMRLSLDVAKRLFELQDLLGCDKASETVDWLLTESKAAILDLLPDWNSIFMGVSNSTSISDVEAVSGDDQATTKVKAKSSSGRSKKQKKKITRVKKYSDSQHPVAKETRIRARQRARERTIEKQNNYTHGVGQDSTFRPFLDQVMDIDVNQLGSWSTFQESQPQCIDQHNQISSNFQSTQGFDDTPSYFFDYQHCLD